MSNSEFYIEIIRTKSFLARRPQWRWLAKANNGEILCHSESYFNRGDLLETVHILFGTPEIRG